MGNGAVPAGELTYLQFALQNVEVALQLALRLGHLGPLGFERGVVHLPEGQVLPRHLQASLGEAGTAGGPAARGTVLREARGRPASRCPSLTLLQPVVTWHGSDAVGWAEGFAVGAAAAGSLLGSACGSEPPWGRGRLVGLGTRFG